MEIFKDNILLENNLHLLLKSHYIRRITFRNVDSCRLYGWQEIGHLSYHLCFPIVMKNSKLNVIKSSNLHKCICCKWN
jgi:hypothetical protein